MREPCVLRGQLKVSNALISELTSVACVVHDKQIVFAVMLVHMLENFKIEIDLGIAVVFDTRDPDSIAKACGEDALKSLNLGNILMLTSYEGRSQKLPPDCALV